MFSDHVVQVYPVVSGAQVTYQVTVGEKLVDCFGGSQPQLHPRNSWEFCFLVDRLIIC